MTNTTVDLCTINYGTWPLMLRQISALKSDEDSFFYRYWDLFIADNEAPGDNSLEMLHSVFPPEKYDDVGIAHIVRNKNIGYAAAANQLASLGKGDIIGILNSDVWLTTSDVYKIVALFDNNPEIAILGPKQRDENGKITHAGIFGTNTAPKHRGWLEADPSDRKYKDTVEAVTVSGAAYFIRRSVWEDLSTCPTYVDSVKKLGSKILVPTIPLGAFLPTRHYYEETYCSYHAKEHGYKVFYTGEVSIGHSWHASHEKGSWQDRLFQESQVLFRQACDDHGIDRD